MTNEQLFLKLASEHISIQIIDEKNKFNRLIKQLKNKKNIFVVDDRWQFDGSLSLEEIGALYGRLYGTWQKDSYISTLHYFKLEESYLYGSLSKGMKIKSELAFAISTTPQILILHNITDGLDICFKRDLISNLNKVLGENNSIVITSLNFEVFHSQLDYYGIYEGEEINIISTNVRDIHEKYILEIMENKYGIRLE